MFVHYIFSLFKKSDKQQDSRLKTENERLKKEVISEKKKFELEREELKERRKQLDLKLQELKKIAAITSNRLNQEKVSLKIFVFV